MEARETNKFVKIQYEGADVGEINIKSTFIVDEFETQMAQITNKLNEDLENAKTEIKREKEARDTAE